MPKLDLISQVEKINARLKSAGIPVRVRINGSVLGLRATLPAKPGKGVGRKQQDIRLGLPGNRDGLRAIELQANELNQQLVLKTFSWEQWERSRPGRLDEIPVAELLVKFKDYYLSKNRITEATWNDQWQRTFKRLPQSESLTEMAMLAVVLATDADTESRKRTCQRLHALAEYAGIPIDLSEYRGDYGYASIKPRDLPSDELIAEWRDRIPNPAWQWAFGMMAVFGLRPHEVFFCEIVDTYTVKIQEGTKTGVHIARALPPEWAEQWNLSQVIRPKVTGSRPTDFGNRNKRQFGRYGVPFPAYNLRHAYALRGTLQHGMDTREMAKMMGHSESVHIRTYRRWLSEIEVQRSYESKVLKRS